MKLALIMLVAIAAVAIGASVKKRGTGLDVDGAGAGAESIGHEAAAESGLEQTKDRTVAVGRASAAYGRARSSSISQSVKLRKSSDEENASE